MLATTTRPAVIDATLENLTSQVPDYRWSCSETYDDVRSTTIYELSGSTHSDTAPSPDEALSVLPGVRLVGSDTQGGELTVFAELTSADGQLVLLQASHPA